MKSKQFKQSPKSESFIAGTRKLKTGEVRVYFRPNHPATKLIAAAAKKAGLTFEEFVGPYIEGLILEHRDKTLQRAS